MQKQLEKSEETAEKLQKKIDAMVSKRAEIDVRMILSGGTYLVVEKDKEVHLIPKHLHQVFYDGFANTRRSLGWVHVLLLLIIVIFSVLCTISIGFAAPAVLTMIVLLRDSWFVKRRVIKDKMRRMLAECLVIYSNLIGHHISVRRDIKTETIARAPFSDLYTGIRERLRHSAVRQYIPIAEIDIVIPVREAPIVFNQAWRPRVGMCRWIVQNFLLLKHFICGKRRRIAQDAGQELVEVVVTAPLLDRPAPLNRDARAHRPSKAVLHAMRRLRNARNMIGRVANAARNAWVIIGDVNAVLSDWAERDASWYANRDLSGDHWAYMGFPSTAGHSLIREFTVTLDITRDQIDEIEGEINDKRPFCKDGIKIKRAEQLSYATVTERLSVSRDGVLSSYTETVKTYNANLALIIEGWAPTAGCSITAIQQSIARTGHVSYDAANVAFPVAMDLAEHLALLGASASNQRVTRLNGSAGQQILGC